MLVRLALYAMVLYLWVVAGDAARRFASHQHPLGTHYRTPHKVHAKATASGTLFDIRIGLSLANR